MWTVTYFAPRGTSGEFEACELSFLNLTIDQYEKDQQFLRKILDSVRYDAAAQTVIQTPAAPTTPGR
jgi:hypothetical protein